MVSKKHQAGSKRPEIKCRLSRHQQQQDGLGVEKDAPPWPQGKSTRTLGPMQARLGE